MIFKLLTIQGKHISTTNLRQQQFNASDVCINLAQPKLGPIANWGLNVERKQLTVDTERFSTNVEGIFAVGDINTYPGKKKLILCGFHEAALAAFAIKARMNPGAKVHLQYTTTSPIMHQRLGVSPSVELSAI